MRITKSLKKKLNTRGASLIVALVIFIICTFVALAIVNSSILNARRTIAEKKEEIAFAATTQAMKLIRECVEDDATYRYDPNAPTSSGSQQTSDPIIKGMDDKLGESVKELADAIIGSPTRPQFKEISFRSTGVEDKLQGTLTGRITMYPSYTITVDVWIEDGKEDYPLTLTIPGSSETVKEDVLGSKAADGSYTTRDVTYISWSKKGMYMIGKKSTSTSNP